MCVNLLLLTFVIGRFGKSRSGRHETTPDQQQSETMRHDQKAKVAMQNMWHASAPLAMQLPTSATCLTAPRFRFTSQRAGESA